MFSFFSPCGQWTWNRHQSFILKLHLPSKWKNSPIFLRSLEQLSTNTLNCKSYQYIFKANKLNLPQDRICIGQANAARILPPLSSWDTC